LNLLVILNDVDVDNLAQNTHETHEATATANNEPTNNIQDELYLLILTRGNSNARKAPARGLINRRCSCKNEPRANGNIVTQINGHRTHGREFLHM